MNTKQKIALGVVAGATVLAGAYGVTTAKAADTTTLPPMVQGVAEKFGLNKDEVQKYMTEKRQENRVERQAVREASLTTKLDEAVKAGKITESQKTAILAKHEEIQAKREGYSTLTQAERRAKMQELRTEMQTFLKEQGIDGSVMPTPQGPKGGMGGGMHRGQR